MSGHRSYFNLGLGACLAVSLSAVAADGADRARVQLVRLHRPEHPA